MLFFSSHFKYESYQWNKHNCDWFEMHFTLSVLYIYMGYHLMPIILQVWYDAKLKWNSYVS